MNTDSFYSPQHAQKNDATVEFCNKFSAKTDTPKYILGRNIYAECVAQHVKIDGFIDDFSNEQLWLGLPIFKLADIPQNSLVLNAAGGRPLSAKRQLEKIRINNLDYFAFYKNSSFPLLEARFNEGFEHEFLSNRSEYEWIYSLLGDQQSKQIFQKLVNFRFTYDISHLEGFIQREESQYFENFLNLNQENEVFIDVGAYDGFTSIEFIKHCPQYQSIHLFEPDPNNYLKAEKALANFPNIHFHHYGLSTEKAELKFDMMGSSSKISDDGKTIIPVNKLDSILDEEPTFIKMDIEGGESAAIEGARETISKYQPRLAIAAYHSAGDFWRIPKQVLSIRNDYNIYIRHYTECIYETVMFFLPKDIQV